MANIGDGCNINIQKLIATRMLVNANSGGGKSYALRKFLEESSGQVQQIILDLEGEFISLREKGEYLIIGNEGDIPISIRTAEILSRKLMETKMSAVIDLSELKKAERILFVKRFLENLMELPKSLYSPLIVVVDEAHLFCPEGKSGKAESTPAVIDLMTRGRKRGYCGVLATQRIAKLNKDAMAECNNYLIGRTGLDIDMKRAGDILGFTSKKQIAGLRMLRAGEFFVFGSAFEHDGIKEIKIGKVKTTHPDRTRGITLETTPPTSERIKKILATIGDLPKEAEEELRTTSEMKNKIRELKTKLTILEKSKPKPKIDEGTIQARLESQASQSYNLGLKEGAEKESQYQSQIRILEKKILDIGRILGQEVKPIKIPEIKMNIPQTKPLGVSPPAFNRSEQDNLGTVNGEDKTGDSYSKPLRAGAMKILGWLGGAYPNTLTKQRIATLSGFSVKGGTFNTYISELKRNNWVVGSDKLIATEEGLRNSNPKEIPSGEELLRLWKGRFRAGAGKILQLLFESYPNEVSKEDIGYSTGFEPTGGTFNTYISELKRNGLIEVNGRVRISDEFFE